MRNRVLWFVGAAVFLSAILLAAPSADAGAKQKLWPYKQGKCPYKVYVILGMHANFYHSWRGDTPDEAGFGQDIRIVREIIKMLDEANAEGLQARVYWEGESLFTFEDIVPKHAPDIIEGIKRRIDAGLDEWLLAPYSNTLFSAVTEDEMRAVIRWSISNPWGSGGKDLFGSYAPIIRPQETMATTGQVPIMLDEGVEGIALYYSGFAFNGFSTFVPLMSIEQRYGLTEMRMRDGGEKMLLFPCVGTMDVLNQVSLERWMLDLRKLQTSGKVKQDLVIHYNWDADADNWIPLVPEGLRWIPNSGGLPEFIKYVNKYEWAEFTVPGEYIAAHEPVGEVVIRQDMADGGWDGNYSWAEKYPSHIIWTDLEKSRLYTYRAEALTADVPSGLKKKAHALLYEGRDSSFFHRVRGLSTTHYGMSTPMVNEERQAVAERVSLDAKGQAEKAERMLADKVRDRSGAQSADTIYSFAVTGLGGKAGYEKNTLNLLRVPLIMTDWPGLILTDQGGKEIPFSVVNAEKLDEDRTGAELMVLLELGPGETRTLTLRDKLTLAEEPPGAMDKSLRKDGIKNDRIELVLNKEHGVASFKLDGKEIGGKDFLEPFITYTRKNKDQSYGAERYQIMDFTGEIWQGLERAGLKTSISFPTDHGDVAAELQVVFTLPRGAPWLVADITVDYPYTVKDDMLHNIQQKLRRYLDQDWKEVAPFQIHPLLDATREDPIKVWKHNWLDVTSWYEVDYGQLNPKNAELDSFNHQVTAGWVAVTDEAKGLLLAQSSDVLTSYAFCAMRLREDNNQSQLLYLNPFGSYHGKQMDYSHMGGNGLGYDLGVMGSSALRPNGSSYNGRTESFSLLLAPYLGDEPPKGLQAEAMAFFYPPEVVYLKTPSGVSALLRQDMEQSISSIRNEEAKKATGPLPAPLAFLVNPTESAVDIVWDEPDDARIEGYEILWKHQDAPEWESFEIDRDRRHRLEGMTNERVYRFRMRSIGTGRTSDWTETLICTVGPVETAGILSMASDASLSNVLKTLFYINVHLLTTPP
jgi:hypothetical protein